MEEERETAVAEAAATEAARKADLAMVGAFGCLENFWEFSGKYFWENGRSERERKLKSMLVYLIGFDWVIYREGKWMVLRAWRVITE